MPSLRPRKLIFIQFDTDNSQPSISPAPGWYRVVEFDHDKSRGKGVWWWAIRRCADGHTDRVSEDNPRLIVPPYNYTGSITGVPDDDDE